MKVVVSGFALLTLAACATAPTSAPVRTPAPAPAPAPEQTGPVLNRLISPEIASDPVATMGIVSGVRDHCGFDWQGGFVSFVQEAARLGYDAGQVADDHGYYLGETKAQLSAANYQCTDADAETLHAFRPDFGKRGARGAIQPDPTNRPMPAPGLLDQLISDDLATDSNAIMGIVSGAREHCGLDWESGFQSFIDTVARAGGDLESAADDHGYYASQAKATLEASGYRCTEADIAELTAFGK